jgi:hypothetical protein
MRRAAAILAAALSLAACSTAPREIAPGVVAVAADQPPQPGSVRFGIAGLNDEKWTATIRQGAPDGSVRYGFTCKVLVCPEPAVVLLTTRRSPQEQPDPKALERIAKESIPKLTQAESLQLQVRTNNQAKAETLSSAVATIRTYPAITSETKLTAGSSSRYISIATIFAGKILVTIRAEAADRAVAKIAVDDFSRAFRVEEGPPVP